MITRMAQRIAEANGTTGVEVLQEKGRAVHAEINYGRCYEALNEPTDET